MQNIMSKTIKKVTIVDYHLGNLFSVKQACDVVGMNASITSSAEDIYAADAIILPGVGAFREAMNNLDELNLIEPIKKSVAEGRPIFGICLGLQLLFTESEEFGSGNGLDLIKGVIKKFPPVYNEEKVRVPQIGWNKVYKDQLAWENTALKDIDENEFMYFVHSYYAEPTGNDTVITKTNYAGIEYCSGVMRDNIFATQFHPEKSAAKGLTIYKNWAEIHKLI